MGSSDDSDKNSSSDSPPSDSSSSSSSQSPPSSSSSSSSSSPSPPSSNSSSSSGSGSSSSPPSNSGSSSGSPPSPSDSSSSNNSNSSPPSSNSNNSPPSGSNSSSNNSGSSSSDSSKNSPPSDSSSSSSNSNNSPPSNNNDNNNNNSNNNNNNNNGSNNSNNGGSSNSNNNGGSNNSNNGSNNSNNNSGSNNSNNNGGSNNSNNNNDGSNNNNNGSSNNNNNGSNNNNNGSNNNNKNGSNNNNQNNQNNQNGQNGQNQNNQNNQNQQNNQNNQGNWTPKNSGNNWSPPALGGKTHNTPPDEATSPPSKGSSSAPIIIGVVAAGGFLLLIMVLFFLACSKKRKRRQNSSHLMENPDPYRGNDYWASGPAKSTEHVLNMPPSGRAPNGGWTQSTAPPPMVSSEMSSSNFSGPHGPPLPPPHPNVVLGFNKSTFTYEELAVATSGFSQAKLIGQGGFGYVHKGVLPNGKEIAVKSLKAGSGQGDREFAAEVEIISRVHHRHLVSLVGYCLAGDRKLLVYEYIPNNNLEYHLYGQDRPPLEWTNRMKIALGSAKGLAYLHEDCHPKIIHRDIKAANILIDYSFEAKVADFGLAKLNQENVTHVSTRVMGTFGYLAPEYASSGKLTEKSDVFSFGIMLLELITGRRPVDLSGDYEDDTLVDWARPLCMKAIDTGDYSELLDKRLQNYNQEEVARMVACAAASVRHSAKKRPKMSQIVRALEGDVSLEDLHEGMKPLAGSNSTSMASSEFDSDSYNAKMKGFRKPALMDSADYPSSEYGPTSE